MTSPWTTLGEAPVGACVVVGGLAWRLDRHIPGVVVLWRRDFGESRSHPATACQVRAAAPPVATRPEGRE